MPDVYFVVPNFINESSTSSILSIRFSTDGFSFCAHDEGGRLTVFAHKAYATDCREAAIAYAKHRMENEPLLNLRYRQVFLLPCFREKTLIPEPFFQEDTAGDLCALTGTGEGDNLLFHHVAGVGAYLAEGFPRGFREYLQEKYPLAHIVNPAYLFLQESVQEAARGGERAYVDAEDGYADVAVYRDGRLLLFNTHECQGEMDVVYYLLNALQVLGVKRETCTVALKGGAAGMPRLQDTLKEYIPHVQAQREERLRVAVKDKHFDASPYTYLLNVHACEL